jgi:NADH:ubiquinone oxidoreductase subunit 2 (subunit N)
MSFFFGQSLMPNINWAIIAPEIIVCLAAVVVMMVDAFSRSDQRWLTGGLSLAGLLSAAAATIWLWTTGSSVTEAFGGMIVLDELRLGFTLVFILVSGLTLLLSIVWVKNNFLPASFIPYFCLQQSA